MMKQTSSLLSLLALAASAVAAPAVAVDNTESWLAGVWLPSQSDPILGTPISASGGKFWLNKNSAANCPAGIKGLDCSQHATADTNFRGGNGGISLDVVVPGGQQVYVAPDGSLSFTVPHSAFQPEGSVSEGFSRGGTPTVLALEGRNWHICPVGAGVWQIYLVEGSKDGCKAFQMRTYPAGAVKAWQYL